MSATLAHLLACAPATQRGTTVHLGQDPKGKHFLYCNGKTVIIRDIENPEKASAYTEHTANVTVAKYSPSGFYIASGDVAGNVRIWDATQEEHILKFETKALGGRVNDLSWDADSKRIIAVGDGKEAFAHAFLFDTGNTVGDMCGHAKTINAVAIRPCRPYRAVTVSDDRQCNVYAGPPFKFMTSATDHERFVQCVRYAPDGKMYVTVGLDAKIFLYDGSTGEKVKEMSSDDGHKAGIMSVAWSPDSTRLLTVSADTTAKIWDVAENKLLHTVRMPEAADAIQEQQVGCLWQGEYMLSVSLSGDINYLSLEADQPVKRLQSHSKAITALAKPVSSDTFYSASYDGAMYGWKAPYASGTAMAGTGHSSQVSGAAVAGGETLYSIGMDDMLRGLTLSDQTFDADKALAIGVQPKAIAVSPKDPELAVIVTVAESLLLVRAGKKMGELSGLAYTPTSAAIHPDGVQVAVGAADNKVYLYKLANNNAFEVDGEPLANNRGIVSSVAYSPDGQLLAVADANRAVFCYNVATRELKIREWVFHHAKVNCLAWSPSGKFCASGGIDQHAFVWRLDKPMKKIHIKGAHLDAVTGVAFLSDECLVTTGQDACVRVWTLTHHQV